MTAPLPSDNPAGVGRHQPASRTGARRSAESGDDLSTLPTSELAAQVGEAAAHLGERLSDPRVPHNVEEIEEITQALAETVSGVAVGLDGITEWLRATGHGGTLSGHASVVAARLAHAGDELALLKQVIGQAGRRAG